MKKIFISIFAVAAMASANGQQLRSGLRAETAAPQRSKQIQPDQRRAMLKQARENILMDNLDIQEEKKDEFKSIYSDYQEEQRKIKSRFSNDFDPDKLTDSQAESKLEESFTAGEELLESRRNLARKMKGVMKPQQVLKMFRTEGMIREKMLERRSTIQDSQNISRPVMQGNESGMRGGRQNR